MSKGLKIKNIKYDLFNEWMISECKHKQEIFFAIVKLSFIVDRKAYAWTREEINEGKDFTRAAYRRV